MEFAQNNPKATRLDQLIFAFRQLDGKRVSPEQAKTILKALPRPARERVLMFYHGSLPARRLLEAQVPYVAPEVQVFVQQVEDELEAQEEDGETMLDQAFPTRLPQPAVAPIEPRESTPPEDGLEIDVW